MDKHSGNSGSQKNPDGSSAACFDKLKVADAQLYQAEQEVKRLAQIAEDARNDLIRDKNKPFSKK